jgi:V8-like Glu-specific endopeptidase
MSMFARWHRALLLVLLPLFALLASFALAVPNRSAAQPGPADSDSTVFSAGPPRLSAAARALVTGSGPDAEARALARYWTPERMRTARPADQILPSMSSATAVAGRVAADAGAPGKIEPTGPVVETGGPEKIEPGGPVSEGSAAPRPQSFAPDLPPTDALARTYGKVFFTNASDGLAYVCSATVVNSIRRDTVWSAGHCVHGGPGGTWHQDWQFVPAYKDGISPFGTWTADRLATRPDWIEHKDFSEDLGAVVVAPRDGRRIVDVLGGQGIAWNHPPAYAANSFGYPQAPPFDGEKLIGCDGAAGPAGIDFVNVIRLDCDMTGGSSGGGWLREVNLGMGYLNGLNSFGVLQIPNVMFSPYYGENVRRLYDDVVNER